MNEVYCITTNQTFASTYEAARVFGIDPSGIGLVCRGEKETICGYRFKYTAVRTCANKRKPLLQKQPKEVLDRPLTLDTKIMMVVDLERGKTLKRLADGTCRTTKALRKELEQMKRTGEYDRIRNHLGIDRRCYVGISHTDRWANNGKMLDADAITQGA